MRVVCVFCFFLLLLSHACVFPYDDCFMIASALSHTHTFRAAPSQPNALRMLQHVRTLADACMHCISPSPNGTVCLHVRVSLARHVHIHICV